MPSGWRDVSCITSDEAGRLYGIRRPTSNGAPGQIWVANIFQQLLEEPVDNSQGLLQQLHSVTLRQAVATSPPLDFHVTSAAASANGHQLLLAGTSIEDADVPILALVDLYGAELVDPRGAAAGPAPSGASDPAASATPRRLRAQLTLVHQELYSRRPGLRLLQAGWHPASPGHFAALASDGVWRLYTSADPAEPEQSFALKLPAGFGAASGAGGGMGLGLAARRAAGARPVAFAWGPPGGGGGWSQLSVLFLGSDGRVYCLCPVAPFGMRVAAGALRRLLASCMGPDGSGTARAWLQAAFPGVVHPAGEVLAAGEGFTVQPHLLETWSPALQGPLNAGCESAAPSARRAGGAAARAAAIAVGARSAAVGGRRLFADEDDGEDSYYPASHEEGDGDAYGGGGVTCCAVLTALDNGMVYTHALDAGALAPAWTEGLSQCAYSQRMDVAAVRYECEALQVAGAGAAGGGSALTGSVAEPLDPDEDDRVSTAASRPARRTGAAPGRAASSGQLGAGARAAAARAESGPMVLVDLIDLRIREEQPPRDGLGDWDDERDADDDEEEEEEEEGGGGSGTRPQRLRRFKLHTCPEQPGAFWLVHDRGAWGLALRWLTAVARRFAAATAAEEEGFGGLDAYGAGEDGGGGGAESGAAGGGLPAPALRELLLSGDGIVASAAIGSVLAGSSCVLLERSGRLSVARPGVPVRGGGDADGAGVEEEDGGVLSEERQQQQHLPDAAAAHAAVQELYAELRAGPRPLPEPQAPAGGADVRTPAGKEYLAAQLSWLQGKYVRFVASAHSDTINRARQLQYEVRDQVSAAGELKAFSGSLVAKQAELATRIERLKSRHTNLLERLKVLALLHWGAPRPLSRAERDFARQLEVWEQQQREASAGWQALKQRIDTMLHQEQQQRQGAAARPGAAAAPLSPALARTVRPGATPLRAASGAAATTRGTGIRRPGGGGGGAVPEEQLGRLYAALAAQRDVISAGRQRLEMLREDLQGFLSNHPEAQLPAVLSPLSAALSNLT